MLVHRYCRARDRGCGMRRTVRSLLCKCEPLEIAVGSTEIAYICSLYPVPPLGWAETTVGAPTARQKRLSSRLP